MKINKNILLVFSAILVSLVFCIFFFFINKYYTPLFLTNHPKKISNIGHDSFLPYFLGEIIVSFKDGVKKQDVIDLVKYYNLEEIPSFKYFSDNFSINLYYKIDELSKNYTDNKYFEERSLLSEQIKEKDKKLNGENTIILDISVLRSDTSINIEFIDSATKSGVKDLVSGFTDLETKDIYYPINFVYPSVPNGEEKKWIEILKNENIVEDADLNYDNNAFAL